MKNRFQNFELPFSSFSPLEKFLKKLNFLSFFSLPSIVLILHPSSDKEKKKILIEQKQKLLAELQQINKELEAIEKGES